MVGQLQPLAKQFAITHEDGTPTDYFIRFMQQKQIDITDGINKAEAEALIEEWSADREIIAGVALDGGGFLDADVTIDHADTAVTPGVYGDSTHSPQITVDQQGHITDVSNIPISGGGGGKPWYWKPPIAADFSTCYASFRGGSAANPPTFTNDPDVGMSWIDLSADNPANKPCGRPIPPAFVGPGTTFTVDVHLTANAVNTNTQWGIWVRANANQYIFFGIFNRGTTINVQRAIWNSAWNDGSFTLAWNNIDSFLRIVVSNQTTSYYISADGKFWKQCYSSENLFTAPFTDYGIYAVRFNAASDRFNTTCDRLVSSEFP